MTNLTIVNNSSAMGGGYYCNETANPVLANSIIWNNIAGDSLGSQVWVWDVFSKPEFYYCNIQGGLDWFGGSEFIGVYENTLNLNPNLQEGWKININSVCANAGTPDTSGFNIPEFDFFGLTTYSAWTDRHGCNGSLVGWPNHFDRKGKENESFS